MSGLLVSRKFWIALAGILGALGAAWGLPPDKVNAVVAAIVTLSGILIGGIAHEDAAKKAGGAEPPPAGTAGTGTRRIGDSPHE